MLLINLINHLLQQNPEVCHELSGYNGLVIGIRAGSLHIVGRFTATGLLTPTHRNPDTTLIVHHDALPKLLQGQLPDFNDLAVEGDMALGMSIALRCLQLHYTPHADLCRLFGEETVHHFMQKAAKWGQILQTAGQILQFQIAQTQSQAQREQALHEQIDAYAEELAQLRQRIAQLEKQTH